jgi:membrane fusion protein, multidrug efflux system
MRRSSLFLALIGLQSLAPHKVVAAEVVVHSTIIDDIKAVIASVEPAHQLVARARISGTVNALRVKEGDTVTANQEIALISDKKLQLQTKGYEERTKSQQAMRDKAKIDFSRAETLYKKGTVTRAFYDQAKTALDVAERNYAAMTSDEGVSAQQIVEGSVLAPSAGRVLTIPVSVGKVVMPGETIATLAVDNYILRLQLPERHARFMRAGDTVEIGERGIPGVNTNAKKVGRVIIVYPEIQGGRVMADVEVKGIGDYFAGERARVYVSTGKRNTLLVPENAVFKRAGVSFVKLKGGAEIVVQTGETLDKRIEILAGLNDGDVVVMP